MSDTRSILDWHSLLGLACAPAACLVALAALPSAARAQTVVAAPPKSEVSGAVSPVSPTATAAHGQQVSGHWPHQEITFHVTADPKNTRTPAEARALVAQGIGLWNERLNGLLRLRMVDDADPADVDVHFVALNTLPGKPRGKTDVQFTLPEKKIEHAILQVDDGLPADILVLTIAHECGHALGIQGHSHGEQGMMRLNPPLGTVVTAEDVNLLRRIYPMYDKSRKTNDITPPKK